jgi:hypothetical protein
MAVTKGSAPVGREAFHADRVVLCPMLKAGIEVLGEIFLLEEKEK